VLIPSNQSPVLVMVVQNANPHALFGANNNAGYMDIDNLATTPGRCSRTG
jgi:hypothetical protein